MARHRSPLGLAALWIGFVAVHLWLSYTVLNGPHTPLNDVSTVYRDWMLDGARGLGWVGLDVAWVYPPAALAPMLLSASFGFAHYSGTWLVLVAALDAVALAVVARRSPAAGAWWLVFLVALGPIAVGRIDSITVPLAIVALLIAARRPAVASALLALATWIKVWPFGLVAAVLIAGRRRLVVLISAAATSVVVVLAALLAGGTATGILGFVGKQTGRGLQLEAPVTTIWLWLEASGVPGVRTYFDHEIITYQVAGTGTSLAAALMTPLMVVVLAGVAGLGLVAARRGADRARLLAPLSLALATAFIVTNKVGSPQYETWLAAPVLLGLVVVGREFLRPAILTVVVAALTQVVYPWQYDALVFALPWMVVVITLRNLLLVVLLADALRRVWLAGRAVPSGVVPGRAPVSGVGARMDA